MTNSKQFFSYSIYGLTVRCFLPLTNLLAENLQTDVEITLGNVKSANLFDRFRDDQLFFDPYGVTGASRENFYIERNGYGSFFIKNGREVIVEPDSKVSKDALIAFLTGPVIGVILHQRENLVLHASAVQIEGKSCIFLGNKGYGKSTVAAHLQSRGHKLISDDIVPIQFDNNKVRMMPGYAQIRLLPESVESIGLNTKDLSSTNDFIPKYNLNCKKNFSPLPTELSCIFVLEKTDKVIIKEMPPAKSFIEVTRNSYLHRYIKATNKTSIHFNSCQRLVQLVPTFQLGRPHDFNIMPGVVKQLELHISALG